MDWLRRIFLRRRLYEDLQEEMQQHLEERAAELTAGGMNADEALFAARREFGNRTLLEEQGREVWQWTALENVWRDVRIAVRRLSKAPALTAICVFTLGLGLGASVALFSIVQAVLLKPLPFPDSGRLVALYESDNSATSMNQVAAANFTDWQRESRSFEQMALWGPTVRSLSSSQHQLPESVRAGMCTWNFFRTLRLQPALGRNFLASDDRPQAEGAVLLSWGLFQRRFGGDPELLGKTVSLDEKSYTVVGILPAWFNYPDAKTQLWLPAFHEQAPFVMQSHGLHKWDVVARLKPGVPLAAARTEIDAIQARIHRQFPNEPALPDAQLQPLVDAMVLHFKAPLYMLLVAVGCLLLITCLNVANLMVARAASRRKELSIRTALGGRRWSMVREQLMESLLLSLGGSILGLALAPAAIEWALSVRSDLPRAASIHIDLTVVLFASAITLGSALVAGLLPSISLRGSLLQALHESSRSVSSNRSHARLRKLLLGIEVAFTVVLLIGAGLLVKSFFQLRGVPLGFNPDHMLSISFSLPKIKYSTPAQTAALFEEVGKRARSLPGVRNAGLITTLPGGGFGGNSLFTITEHPPLPKDQLQAVIYRGVDPHFFATMQIPLLRGRTFRDGDRLGNAHFAIISEAFAKQFFPDEDPLGKHIDTNGPPGYQIVGVVGDTPYLVSQPVQPMTYFPLYEGTRFTSAALVVRSAVNPLSLALPIQKQIAKIDPNLAVANILTMDQVIGQSTAAAGFTTYLILAFAGLSLLLAAMGLYGVLSYVVTQRTNEMGVRIALGAPRGELLRLMLFDGLKPAVIGLVFGLAGGVAASRLIESLLFGVHPLDVGIFTGVPLLLLAVAAMACLSPALRASNTDPIEALRRE